MRAGRPGGPGSAPRSGRPLTTLESAHLNTMGTITATLLLLLSAGVVGTLADCHYEGHNYKEGDRVHTEEPCLNCSCVRGSPVCHLRVCPVLPNPPPPGCVLLKRRGHCCSELICDGDAEDTSWDSDIDGGYDGRGCMVNGTLYAEGSAMASSSQCNFCYCIHGQQRCVEPQCLLPLQGCTPQYQQHSCCPMRYDCSEAVAATTTPASAKGSFTGCEVDGKQYSEGDMVQGVANSSCDNCFCMKGKVQCVPLTCSIPLQSCKPVILPGDCCPSSFACGVPDKRLTSKHNTSAQAKKNTTTLENTASLSITYNMEPNNFERIDGILVRSKPRLPTVDDDSGLLGNTLPSESRSNREMPAKINDTILKNPKKNNTRDITTTPNTDNQTEILSTTDMTTTTEITTEMSTITTTDATTITSTEPTTVITAETTLANETDETTTESMVLNETESEEEISANNKIIQDKVRNETNSTTSPITYDPTMQNQTLTTERTPIQDTGTQNVTSTKVIEPDILERTSVTDLPLRNNDEADIITEAAEEPITMQTETTFMTLMPTTVIMPEELDVVNVTLHKNVSIAVADNNSAAVNESLLPVRAIPPEIEAILNITHNKDEDYEYDYNEPSLPPSLPGVRIIPFVAADAVVEDKNSPTSYPKQDKHRPTDNPVFYKVSHPNLFSPPAETEGGFVPREPILDGPFYESKFDVPYHTTGMNIPAAHISLDITSGTIIPPAITILPKTEDEHCLMSGREYRHGDLLPSSDPCLHCICYYGEVLCQAVKCPAVKSGCRRLKDKEHSTCCGRIVCADKSESPTVVLDRMDVTAHPQTLQQPPPHLGGIVPPITVADGVVTPDPFRDVIRTEPAPDLPSLISDIMPYLLERHTSTSSTASVLPAITTAASTPGTTTVKATTSRTTTTKTSATTAHTPTPANHENIKNKDTGGKDEVEKEDDDSGFSFDSVLQFLFSGDPTNPPQLPAPTTTRRPPIESSTLSTSAQETSVSKASSESATVSTEEIPALNTTQQLLEIFNISLDTSEMSSTPESVASSPGSSSVDPGATSGLLKLAGCNIYGRMYRVGRIISELSGPCLECMCTEVGVQCRALDC